ncbi:MAG: Co2+/Mg2+ efflux protein ApaG [Deltaproteobacteria bacterium]|nr:Co2+/Mg2+ efflux protein ApaG [Deltaproteobacteria bacterium]MBI4196443.1 Co2+/Mg2+ efflux protein ApaG [Deltaproteobacteria bacterium]
MPSSEAITQGIRIQVESKYLPERSDPEQGIYFFVYQIRISNEGDQPAQLISRHWIITDAHGHVEEVKGPGIVGEQPMIEPGEFHEYSSFCPLKTPSGSMKGTYQMIREDGESFDAEIAPFRLSLHGEMLH